jgi:tetratricopeptide (TPR) repeat protein
LVYEGQLAFAGASEEYERALALAPSSAKILSDYGAFAGLMGRTDSALTALHRTVALDPLNPSHHYAVGWALTWMRRYREAITGFQNYQTFKPNDPGAKGFVGINYYLLGDFERARLSCENRSDDDVSQLCLALTYNKLGRHVDAEAALAKLRAAIGSRPMALVATYAQWGDTDRALEWLEKAMRERDPQLEFVKASPLLDPLRKQPRFQAIERELKFPN